MFAFKTDEELLRIIARDSHYRPLSAKRRALALKIAKRIAAKGDTTPARVLAAFNCR